MLVCLLSSCAGKDKVPDVPLCVEFNPESGRCVKIVSGVKFNVDEKNKFEGKTWWEHRPAMIQLPATSWAKLKIFIISVCKKYGKCDEEIASWDRTIKNIDDHIDQKSQ